MRALLNLGHTFGHALEAMRGYSGGLLHGEAVAVGMALAFDFSVALKLCPPADAERLKAHRRRIGSPMSPTATASTPTRWSRTCSRTRKSRRAR
ncbi:MAG: hypothetical protein R3C42_03345 [Parvularculaceae bacterium]